MTRWVQDFDKSAFKKSWTALLELADSVTVDDLTVVTTAEEVARLRKALAFLAGIIATVDLELTPKSVWDQCVKQADACIDQLQGYASDRNATHLVAANEHIDNLLTYVRPYMVYPAEALDAQTTSARYFSQSLTQYLNEFQDSANHTRTSLQAALEHANKQRKKFDELQARIEAFHDYLFGSADGNDGAALEVKQRVAGITTQSAEIQAFHDALLQGPESTSVAINTAVKEAVRIRDSLVEVHSAAAADHETLSQFHDRIFGSPVSEGAEQREGGLAQELETRLKQLDSFELSQHTRHDTIFQKIESLLPGATSASLASAYKTLKDKFADPIKNYTNVFYGSLALLLFGGLAMVIDTVTLLPPSIQLVKGTDLPDMVRTLLTRIPVIVPILWLAIFSATRRSQYERLQQEYAHKEALASSYESFKKQLKDLGGDTDDLQKALIAKAIDAVAYNASTTLDGKHTEKPPAMQILEKLNADELKKLFDLARGK